MKLDKIEKLYSENIEKYGIDSRAVGWNSEDSQYLRFEKLLQVIEDKSQSFTINELGCGYGELYKYLEINKFNFSSFNGYDISQPMLDSFRAYVEETNKLSLIKSSLVNQKADYTITSGIFNKLCSSDVKAWPAYIEKTLINMYEHSNKGMAFNLLTSYVDYKDDDLFYADPSIYFRFCKENLSSRVTLMHDYNLFEWTLMVFK